MVTVMTDREMNEELKRENAEIKDKCFCLEAESKRLLSELGR